MSWVRRAVSIALFVATFGTMGAAILGVMDPLFMLIAWAALFADSVLAIERHHRRLNRPAPAAPAGPVRPDADVAQYLNDGDREWLRDNGDWTDPRASTNSTGWPVVDRISDENGWRTIHYSDGSTEQYAVTDWDRTHRLVAEIRADNERVADSFEQWTERQAADAPDPGPVPDGDYETIVDGLGRPVRYVQT